MYICKCVQTIQGVTTRRRQLLSQKEAEFGKRKQNNRQYNVVLIEEPGLWSQPASPGTPALTVHLGAPGHVSLLLFIFLTSEMRLL